MDTLDELVYQTLIGELSEPYRIAGVENAYADGSACDRLRDRLGIADEDEDVELIIGNLLSIQHTLCLKMFRYGQMLR